MAKLGMLIDRLFIIRENREAIRKEEKEFTGQIEQLTEEIITELETAGIDKAAGERGTVSKKVDIYGGVEDKEKFYKWVVENNRFEFTQSRVNDAAVREMLQQQNVLPAGINTYTKVKLNVRKK